MKARAPPITSSTPATTSGSWRRRAAGRARAGEGRAPLGALVPLVRVGAVVLVIGRLCQSPAELGVLIA